MRVEAQPNHKEEAEQGPDWEMMQEIDDDGVGGILWVPRRFSLV